MLAPAVKEGGGGEREREREREREGRERERKHVTSCGIGVQQAYP